MPIKTKIYSMEPVLPVNDLDETLKYYQETLGFVIDWTWPNEGKIDHASVSFGIGHEDTTEEDQDNHDEHHIHIQLYQAEVTPASNTGWLYLRVDDDIDTLYHTLKERGANIVTELGDRPWGMREFEIKDNNGHSFRFAFPVPHHE